MTDSIKNFANSIQSEMTDDERAEIRRLIQDDDFGPEPKQHGTGPDTFDKALDMLAEHYSKR